MFSVLPYFQILELSNLLPTESSLADVASFIQDEIYGRNRPWFLKRNYLNIFLFMELEIIANSNLSRVSLELSL